MVASYKANKAAKSEFNQFVSQHPDLQATQAKAEQAAGVKTAHNVKMVNLLGYRGMQAAAIAGVAISHGLLLGAAVATDAIAYKAHKLEKARLKTARAVTISEATEKAKSDSSYAIPEVQRRRWERRGLFDGLRDPKP